ncbi:MAG: hypothetical protein FWH42_01050 [Dehalococcoidia bacterium]|nr:hypothetical protein [Dehalococcoidia bacterium]
MKRAVFAVLMAVVLPIVTVACGVSASIEDKAINAFKKTFDDYKVGVFSNEEMDQIVKSFDELGLSAEANKNLVDTFKNIFSKIKYDVKSCQADPEQESVYVISANITTVDGVVVFMSNSVIDAMIDKMIELATGGETDETILFKAGMDTFCKETLNASKTAIANKTSSIELRFEYDSKANVFTPQIDDETAYLLCGLGADFDEAFQNKIDERMGEKLS